MGEYYNSCTHTYIFQLVHRSDIENSLVSRLLPPHAIIPHMTFDRQIKGHTYMELLCEEEGAWEQGYYGTIESKKGLDQLVSYTITISCYFATQRANISLANLFSLTRGVSRQSIILFQLYDSVSVLSHVSNTARKRIAHSCSSALMRRTSAVCSPSPTATCRHLSGIAAATSVIRSRSSGTDDRLRPDGTEIGAIASNCY